MILSGAKGSPTNQYLTYVKGTMRIDGMTGKPVNLAWRQARPFKVQPIEDQDQRARIMMFGASDGGESSIPRLE